MRKESNNQNRKNPKLDGVARRGNGQKDFRIAALAAAM
jgi:hypothetical protein